MTDGEADNKMAPHDASSSGWSNVLLPLVTDGDLELEQEEDGNGDKSDTLSVL